MAAAGTCRTDCRRAFVFSYRRRLETGDRGLGREGGYGPLLRTLFRLHQSAPGWKGHATRSILKITVLPKQCSSAGVGDPSPNPVRASSVASPRYRVGFESLSPADGSQPV